MLFLGDNGRFGAERVELTAERFAEPIVEDGELFPLGVAGLIPVVTSRRKKGGFKTVYAFPLQEGALAETDPADPTVPADPVPADPSACEPSVAQQHLSFELHEAVDFVNLLLGEAAELCGYPFGTIGAIWAGITQKGYCFTRVEQASPNEYGDRGVSPIHLRIETDDHAAAAGSVSAVIEYDRLGYPLNVLIVEHGEEGVLRRIMCSVDFDARDILVQKVVEDDPGESEPLILYWRHPPYWFGEEDEASEPYDDAPAADPASASAEDQTW